MSWTDCTLIVTEVDEDRERPHVAIQVRGIRTIYCGRRGPKPPPRRRGAVSAFAIANLAMGLGGGMPMAPMGRFR